MNVELVNTGSELMFGRILNSHQQWLCRRLTDLGYAVTRQVGVRDTGTDIAQAVREALSRADLVITTGGLGPTSDDLTRDVLAQMLDRPLHEEPVIVAHLERFFAARKRPMPDRIRVQAQVPDGATFLQNLHGTAPGLVIELTPNPFRAGGKGSWLILLPGPPRELRPMFNNAVTPLLLRNLPPAGGFVCRTLRSTGLAESLVQERIAEGLRPLVQHGLDLGYCAHIGQVDVRLAACGENGAELVREAETFVRQQIGTHIFGEGDDELESVVVRLLAERRQTLAIAESCTGGLIAHRITNVPGASAVLLAGFVTYCNEVKQNILGVDVATLAQHGAVSEAVAREMANGARARTGATFALSVTGIAGPTGGAPAKPVGTVFVGLASKRGTVVHRNFNPYDRETFKQATANQALEMLRRAVLAGEHTRPDEVSTGDNLNQPSLLDRRAE